MVAIVLMQIDYEWAIAYELYCIRAVLETHFCSVNSINNSVDSVLHGDVLRVSHCWPQGNHTNLCSQ